MDGEGDSDGDGDGDGDLQGGVMIVHWHSTSPSAAQESPGQCACRGPSFDMTLNELQSALAGHPFAPLIPKLASEPPDKTQKAWYANWGGSGRVNQKSEKGGGVGKE